MTGQSTPQEKAARKVLRAFGLQVEAVGAFAAHGGLDSFAAVVVSAYPGFESQYERAMEVLTDPRCPLVVTEEYHGRQDIRIYVSFARTA